MDTYLCDGILDKLQKGNFNMTANKETIAFKYFALGSISEKEYAMLIDGGVKGFSTFMSYYILSVIAVFDKDKAVSLLKEYYGSMLNKGATTFWEDYDIDWDRDSYALYSLPIDNLKDIHGDFGKYCYQGFRHSLCHGWSTGIIKFIKENCK